MNEPGMRVSLIVAMSEGRVIGSQGQLPWRLSTDLQRFRRLTMGHTIVMGRRTFDSIGRLLPGRISVVLSRQAGRRKLHGGQPFVVGSLSEALQIASGDDEAFVIGGAEVYQQALPLARRIYLTRVHAQLDGDVYFPELNAPEWDVLEETDHEADEKNEYPHTFQILQRNRSLGWVVDEKTTAVSSLGERRTIPGRFSV